MLAGPQPFSLRLDRPVGPGWRAGGLVSVQVLARLGGGRWSVSVQGRTFPASAEVELAPGARLLARVARGGGRIVLRVLGPAVEAEGKVPAALLAPGLNVSPETAQKVRRLLERLRLPPQRFARLAALLLEKGVEPDSPGIAALLENLAYGDAGGRRRGRPWPSSTGQLAEELAGDLRRAGDGEAQPLPLFNHLQAGDEQWFVIPYSYGESSGTIRLRRQQGARQADRLVLATDGPWSFVLSRKASGYALHGFCGEGTPGLRARRGWRRLAQKLQNLGVETDDTIRGGDGFDGFSLPWEAGPHQRVDTEG
jgi:hypothetical protein